MEAIKDELERGASGERWDSLFVRNPLPMAIYDTRTYRVLDVNDAEADRYGSSRDHFRHLTMKNLVPMEDVPKFLELTRELPHFDRTGPWRQVLRDGTIIQVLITSHLVSFAGQAARIVIAENLADPDVEIE
jgi:PAS domain-containing protein